MVELLPLVPLTLTPMAGCEHDLHLVPSKARMFIAKLGYHIAPEFLEEGETEEQALRRVEALYADSTDASPMKDRVSE